MKVIGVIPARFQSSRFPGKPLVSILGKPMIIHVAEKVEYALGKENVYIATEDERIRHVVENHGYKVVMTSDKPLTGTDRLWEFAKEVNADIYINVQGDEPMVNPKDIIKIANIKKELYNQVINGMAYLGEGENPSSLNIPKVLVNKDNDLIYISRLPIPGVKDMDGKLPKYRKQVCIYAFNYSELKSFGELNKKTYSEEFEDIEILRFLDLGIKVRMIETEANSYAVDVPEDVLKVEQALKL